MWRITAQGSVGPEAAQAAVDYLRQHRFAVAIEQVDPDINIDLTEYLVGLAPQLGFAKSDVREWGAINAQKGFATLADLTRVSLEMFLAESPRCTDALFALMVQHGVTFTDVDPAVFASDPITGPDQHITLRTYNVLARQGINSWAMFPALSKRFLLDMPQFKQVRLDEVMAALRARGLSLKD